MRTPTFFDHYIQDLRYAGRIFWKNPTFTAVAVACLALGIGASVAIFNLMNAVMIKSLPVKNPDQLVLFRYVAPKGMSRKVFWGSSGYGRTSLPYATMEQFRGSRLLSGVFGFVPLGFNNQSVTVNLGAQSGVAGGEMVTDRFFSTLGVAPILGRAITAEDARPAAPHVAVISYRYWSRQFGRDASVIGRAVSLNSVSFTIVGVMPPEFFGVNPELAPDLWIPMLEAPGLTPWGVQPPRGESMFTATHWWWLMIMGRRKPGISEEQARAELDLLFQRSITAGMSPSPNPEDLPHLELVPAGQGLNFLRQRFSKPLKILMIAVALVLLIACANVATLLLARAAGRQKEMAVRLAVGASRGRLLRQLITESVVLAAAGGALGMLLAQWGSRALLILMTQEGQSISLDLRLDLTVLALSTAACLLTGILFGLAPALRATRVDLSSSLKESAGTTTFRHGFGRALVAGQVAFSLLLLIGAGLFIRTLQNLQNQDLGFNSRNTVLFALDPRRSGYTNDKLLALYDQVLEKLRSQPGVRSATMSQLALLSGWVNNGPISTDRPKANAAESTQVLWNGVGPDFLKTMDIPLILGRDIEPRDLQGGRNVAVVNEAMALYFFERENPIGRHFNFGSTRQAEGDYEIVGVAKSAKYDSLRNDPPRTIYVPYSSRSTSLGRMYFEVRSAGDTVSITPAIREAVRSVDPGLPLMDLKTQSEQMAEALSEERMFATLCTFFGALALLLVTIGFYGTLAYLVARRTNEIGIRIALGAGRPKVVWMVLRESVLIVLFGAMAGLPIAFATTRFVASQLYGVKPDDPVTIAATLAILMGIGAIAAFIPARRASRVDPMVALRYE